MVCLSISLELLRVVQWRGDVNSDSDACHRTSIGNDGHDFSKKRACAAGVPLLPYRDFHPVTCCILFLFIIHNSTCTRLNVRQSKLHSMSSAPEFVYFHSLSVIHRYRIFQFRPKTNVRHPKSPNVRPNTNVREGFVLAHTLTTHFVFVSHTVSNLGVPEELDDTIFHTFRNVFLWSVSGETADKCRFSLV